MRLRKVLILSSLGGYGHSAAAHTISQLLQDEWKTAISYPINELKICGVPSGESLYNFLISRNFTQLMNWMAGSVAPYLFQLRVKKTIHLIKSRLEQEKPDLLISLIPFINYPASEAARHFKIPLLIVSTDNDLHNWVYGLENVKHSGVKVTIGCDLPSTRGLLQKKGFPEESIETIGLPLRPAFYTPLDKQRLRSQRGILPHRPVVLIMMGGAGAVSALNYAKRLAKLPLNLHLIVCAGRNRALAARLNELPLAKENRLEIFPFTERVQELMALCDLLITKPGPGTLNEAAALRVPLLVEGTTLPLFWEQININLVEQQGIGKVLYSIDHLEPIVSHLLQPHIRVQIEQAYKHLPVNRFHERLPELLDELCQTHTPTYTAARL